MTEKQWENIGIGFGIAAIMAVLLTGAFLYVAPDLAGDMFTSARRWYYKQATATERAARKTVQQR